MKTATQFGMTSIEYMWLGTTQVKTSKAVLTEQLPLGMIGELEFLPSETIWHVCV